MITIKQNKSNNDNYNNDIMVIIAIMVTMIIKTIGDNHRNNIGQVDNIYYYYDDDCKG